MLLSCRSLPPAACYWRLNNAAAFVLFVPRNTLRSASTVAVAVSPASRDGRYAVIVALPLSSSRQHYCGIFALPAVAADWAAAVPLRAACSGGANVPL